MGTTKSSAHCVLAPADFLVEAKSNHSLTPTAAYSSCPSWPSPSPSLCSFASRTGVSVVAVSFFSTDQVWCTKPAREPAPLTVGSVGWGSFGNVGASLPVADVGFEPVVALAVNSTVAEGSRVGPGVGERVGRVPGATGGHVDFHVDSLLQYIKPGPHDPYRERHHDPISHGSPLQEYLFSGSEGVAGAFVGGGVGGGVGELVMTMGEAVGEAFGEAVGDSVTKNTSDDESAAKLTKRSAVSVGRLVMGMAVGDVVGALVVGAMVVGDCVLI